MISTAFTIIADSARISRSENLYFGNLKDQIHGSITKAKPDFYHGSRPADLYKDIMAELGPYIVPSTNIAAPCLSNFFTEGKGLNGNAVVCKRQAFWTDTSLDDLILRVQQHVGSRGYAVVKGRTVAFKKDKIARKAWLRCDRGGNPEITANVWVNVLHPVDWTTVRSRPLSSASGWTVFRQTGPLRLWIPPIIMALPYLDHIHRYVR